MRFLAAVRYKNGGENLLEVTDVANKEEARLEVLEREHAEFFERWHSERRKREKLAHDVELCHRMLLSEPDTRGALFKAENILREAIADAKAKPHNRG